MALHFDREEFASRLDRLTDAMRAEKLDAVLLFAQESMYWLTGYDSVGHSSFQTLIVKSDGSMALLTRSADLRQARHTSIIDNIVVWIDRLNADPTVDLKNLLSDMDLLGARIGVEYDTHGLTGKTTRLLDNQLSNFGQLVDSSTLVSDLRLIKSDAEITIIKDAARLADTALDLALPLIRPGTGEAEILATMQGAILSGGGDYGANEFVIGSGPDAMLTRYKSGRRRLEDNDQITLEWAGSAAHYHAAMMRTIIIGEASPRHRELYKTCRETLEAIEQVLRPGFTFADIFDVHAKILDERGLSRHRMNACGYSLGARFAPSWRESQMFYAGNPQPILPAMTLFVSIVIMETDTSTAMTLGQTYLTTEEAPIALSRHNLDLIHIVPVNTAN